MHFLMELLMQHKLQYRVENVVNTRVSGTRYCGNVTKKDLILFRKYSKICFEN